MAKSEIVVFKGVEFRRYPNSENWADRMYYVPNANHRKKGLGRLHQEIWKDAYGAIPDGCEIHHKDKNPLNNDLDNLECLSSEEHLKLHSDLIPNWKRDWLKERMDIIRPMASNWHSSDEGKEWHQLIGALSWDGKEFVTYVCEYCGQSFKSRAIHGNVRFCSPKCRAANRRKAGSDNEERHCETCNKSFIVNRYSKQRFCSLNCVPHKHA